MKSYPIAFSPPMVKSLLAGSKSQTRRLPTSQWSNLKLYHDAGERCLLWVKEAYKPTSPTYRASFDVLECSPAPLAFYKTDADSIDQPDGWCLTRFMPRNLSRLTLEVTEVRMQKLQEISESDCWAEGIDEVDGMFDDIIPAMAKRMNRSYEDAAPTYACLWESIHGPGSWDKNPSVVAISFRVHQQNIDQFIGGGV